ncbi:MAG: AMP-binding protein, partial [Thermodesulfobacteriota bacterium]
MKLGKTLTRAAGHFKNRCAVVCGDQQRTFSQVDENANRFANGLLALGVRKQDRVVIFCDNCVEYVEMDWGLYKSGMVRVAINPLLSPGEVAYIIKDSGP